MGWIKRNLFFVVGGAITLGALGAAIFFIFSGISSNSQASDTLNGLYAKLQEISQSPLQPGNEKMDNMKAAKEQEQQLRAWITEASAYFHPIAPIPRGDVTSKSFGTALGTTIYQLQQEAKEDSVTLPPQYYFSFQVQSTKLTISSGLGPLAEQLGEVKALAEILFAARVNDLEGIQRVRVSDDDAAGVATDYIDNQPITNDLTIITPYVVTFQTFSPELAKVLEGFATATNPFIVKSVSVQPASASPSDNGAMTGAPGMPGQYPQPGYPPYGAPGAVPYGYRGRMPYGMPPATPEQQPGVQPGRGGLQTVLKEQLLRITMEVDIVKLLPKS
jgi:hypothetical protein